MSNIWQSIEGISFQDGWYNLYQLKGELSLQESEVAEEIGFIIVAVRELKWI